MFAEIFGPDILIVLAIVALIFGGSKLPSLARSLGSAKSEFEKASRGDYDDETDDTASDTASDKATDTATDKASDTTTDTAGAPAAGADTKVPAADPRAGDTDRH